MEISKNEQQIFLALETTILAMLLTENLEQLREGLMFNQQKLKYLSKNYLQALEPILKNHYERVFQNGEAETHTLVRGYESFVKLIREQLVPEKMVLLSFIQCFNADRHTMLATISRVMKKHKLDPHFLADNNGDIHARK